MRDVASRGVTVAASSSAVNTATTPAAWRAAAQSIDLMRACECSLRRNAACRARGAWRSSAKAPVPLRRRGSSVRLMRAPTIFGRAWISAPSIISLGPLAQRVPLRGIVAAYNPGAALFDAADFGERFFQCLGVPGVARDSAGIERRAQAHCVRRQKKYATFLEHNYRASGAGRVARQRNKHDAVVAEQVEFTANA